MLQAGSERETVVMWLFQHYIELSSQYERPRPPASGSSVDSVLSGASVYDRPRAASMLVARQKSEESGVFVSRTSSDTSPQPPARPACRRSSDVITHLSAPRRRSQSYITDAGYLLPTFVDTTPAAAGQPSASQRHSVAATSVSDLCSSTESDNVFELDVLLPE